MVFAIKEATNKQPAPRAKLAEYYPRRGCECSCLPEPRCRPGDWLCEKGIRESKRS